MILQLVLIPSPFRDIGYGCPVKCHQGKTFYVRQFAIACLGSQLSGYLKLSYNVNCFQLVILFHLISGKPFWLLPLFSSAKMFIVRDILNHNHKYYHYQINKQVSSLK